MGRGRAWRRMGTVGALVLLLAFLAPAPAAAHDGLRSASPGEGDTLGVVPDTLRLLFTRPQNLELASVRLVGPGGEVAVGSLRAHPDSGAVVLVPVLGEWAPGPHTVRWRIVGQDGHPVTGEYGFVVSEGARGLPVPEDAGAAPPDDVRGGPAADRPPPVAADGAPEFGVDSPLYVAVRWVGFAALLGVLGAVSWGLLVLPLAGGRDPQVDVEGGRRAAASVGAWAAGFLILATAARLWAQVRALGDAGALDPGLVGTVLGSTVWGIGWVLQVAAAGLAAAAFVWGRRTVGALPWAVAGVGALVLAFTPALSGHAVGVADLTPLAVAADGLHVLAAGGWMGGLLLLITVAVPASRAEDGPGRQALAPLVEAFSLTALAFATVLVLTGVFSGWLHLGTLDALLGSSYGRTLGLKLLLLLPLVATGAYNWLQVRPALSAGDAAAGRIRRSGGAELALAVGVLLVTAVLVATPPPAETGGGEVADSTPPAAEARLP